MIVTVLLTYFLTEDLIKEWKRNLARLSTAQQGTGAMQRLLKVWQTLQAFPF